MKPQKPLAPPNPNPTVPTNDSGLISHEAVNAYHEAKATWDQFCDETDANRKRFNDALEAARQGVFGLVNALLCTEPTIFEVVVGPDGEDLEKPIYYLVNPGKGEIQLVNFRAATAKPTA